MCQYYHNPHNDAIELMSTANVIEASKCVQTMATEGLGSYVPGVPRDVPPQLQAILEFRIGAEFLPGCPTLDTLHPPEALDYLFEIYEAIGAPMQATNVFSVSPLRLSGYEFDLAVAQRERWEEFSVTTYPAAGISAPGRFSRRLGAVDRRSARRGGHHAHRWRRKTGELFDWHVPV